MRFYAPKADHFRGQSPPQNVGLFRAKVSLAHVAGLLVSTSVEEGGEG